MKKIKFSKKFFGLLIILPILIILAVLAFYFKNPLLKSNSVKTDLPQRESAEIQEFNLEIPVLNINTPVIVDVEGNNKDAYFKALENGVAHFKGTKKPGEGGLIFIFGHSSYYALSPGNYKEIFKELENIQNNDEIKINYHGNNFTYIVYDKKVVDPKDLSVLNPTDSEILEIMTCVPPGTRENRLIVYAKPKSTN